MPLQIPASAYFGFASPTIIAGPKSETVLAGGTVTFSIIAAGSVYYQWRKDRSDLNGATNSTLTLTNVWRANVGAYDVTVWNSCNHTNRWAPATLRVLVPQRFEAPTLLADGRLRLPFRDQDGDVATLSYATNYFVPQISTNLVDWQTASGSLSLTNGFLVFDEATPPALPSRFYRIIER